jgi:hypothetical protein
MQTNMSCSDHVVEFAGYKMSQIEDNDYKFKIVVDKKIYFCTPRSISKYTR